MFKYKAYVILYCGLQKALSQAVGLHYASSASALVLPNLSYLAHDLILLRIGLIILLKLLALVAESVEGLMDIEVVHRLVDYTDGHI